MHRTDLKILGIVPARAGSRRFPGKNMAELGGVPLVGRAICNGWDSRVLAAVAVTTDDPRVVDYVRGTAGAHLILRPAELCGPEVPMLPVVLHALRECGNFDAVCLLQPTSPLRTGADVNAVVELLERRRAEAVISVVPCGEDDVFAADAEDWLRPAHVVRPNGAVYLVRTEVLLDGRDWNNCEAAAYLMPPDRSIDVDTRVDFDEAVALYTAAPGRYDR